jgi:hypothetical protein
MSELRACVAFATPGLIPLESFTTFGVNVKPQSVNPFGFFGTGLKYAVAVLLRHGCEVVVWRGLVKYTFYVKQEDFRGKDFGFVRMKKEQYNLKDRVLFRPQYERLPFTLELGKTWELWQAFRELETNTRDENGTTQLEYWGADSRPQRADGTVILVFGSKFIDEFHDMGRNFLEGGLSEREGPEWLQVLDKPSRHIYYRGVRIMDLKEEALYTYNILRQVDLTEDRTAKYPTIVESWIAEYIMSSEDEGFVSKVTRAPPRAYESRMNYAYVGSYARRSPVFTGAAETSTNPTIREIWDRAQPTIPDSVTLHIVIPRSEVTDDEMAELRTAVATIWNLDDDQLEIKNMAKPEEVEF